MSLGRPLMDDRGEIDLGAIDAMSRDDLRRWIRDRLQGRDLSCSGADRTDDMPQYLLKLLYPKLDRATREDFQGIVLDFLADLFRNPDSEWLGEPGSRLLLMLDRVLVQSPRRNEAVGLLLGMADTPRFAEGPFPNLHFRALQALLGLRHRADRRFWERQFQVGGERYSPVVLEGLASIDASVLLDWLAGVPWSEAIGDAFEGLLPSLLEDYGAAKIAALVERVLPRLTPEAASAVTRMCEEEGLTMVLDSGWFGSVTWTVTAAPARNYALILSDHGDGVRGFNRDEDDGGTALGDAAVLTSREVARVLADLAAPTADGPGLHFDRIGFDSCLLGMAEVGYQLRPYTQVLVTSAEEEPAAGFDYTTAFAPLEVEPGAGVKSVAAGLVQSFQAQYQAQAGVLDTPTDTGQIAGLAISQSRLGVFDGTASWPRTRTVDVNPDGSNIATSVVK